MRLTRFLLTIATTILVGIIGFQGVFGVSAASKRDLLEGQKHRLEFEINQYKADGNPVPAALAQAQKKLADVNKALQNLDRAQGKSSSSSGKSDSAPKIQSGSDPGKQSSSQTSAPKISNTDPSKQTKTSSSGQPLPTRAQAEQNVKNTQQMIKDLEKEKNSAIAKTKLAGDKQVEALKKSRAAAKTDAERKKIDQQISDVQKKTQTEINNINSQHSAAQTDAKQELQQAQADLDATNKKLEADWKQAIDKDRDTFNVGMILRAKDQKTLLNQDGTKDSRPTIIIILDRVTTFLLLLSVPVGVLALVIAGYWLIVFSEDTNRTEGGKKIITSTIIGLILIFTSYMIVQFVQSIFYQTF